jgi:predicted RNase H-like HicB family nuclease
VLDQRFSTQPRPSGSEFSATFYRTSDLPGCITTGATLDQTKRNMREAIELHLEAMREVGEAIPEPTSEVDFVDAVA